VPVPQTAPALAKQPALIVAIRNRRKRRLLSKRLVGVVGNGTRRGEH